MWLLVLTAAVFIHAFAPALAAENSTMDGILKHLPAPFAESEQSASGSTDGKTDIDAYEALDILNAYRSANGRRPLALNPQLIVAASSLAADMARHDHLSHVGPEGADLVKRLKNAGYSYALVAENLGAGHRSFAELMARVTNDPAQSKNLLLADATELGIAYEYRADTKFKTFWTLVLAAPYQKGARASDKEVPPRVRPLSSAARFRLIGRRKGDAFTRPRARLGAIS